AGAGGGLAPVRGAVGGHVEHPLPVAVRVGAASMAEARFTVVGGGLAGLMTAIKLAEAGQQVDLLSIVPVKRSHSVCAQGGINGAVNTKGEGDHPDIHVKDTLRGGDFLAEQTSVKGMCYAAPHIIYMLDRMGVPFNRTPEGLLDFRRFGGTPPHRTTSARPPPPRPARAPPPARPSSPRGRGGSAATRRTARSPSTSTGSGWGWCATRAAAASAAWPWTCAPTRSAPSRPRR